jgi:hypothetical protein
MPLRVPRVPLHLLLRVQDFPERPPARIPRPVVVRVDVRGVHAVALHGELILFVLEPQQVFELFPLAGVQPQSA